MKLLDFERRGVLFPLLVAAAIGVIVLSAVSTAAIVGWLPSAHSNVAPADRGAAFTQDGRGAEIARGVAEYRAPPPAPPARLAQSPSGAGDDSRRAPAPTRVATAAPCTHCATVVSVQRVAVDGGSSGLGAVAGGVLGGVLGNQVGGGNGRALATIAGVGGGAYVGNRIEQGMNQRSHYRVAVRIDGGGTRTFTESSARWSAGDRVLIQGDRLEAAPDAR